VVNRYTHRATRGVDEYEALAESRAVAKGLVLEGAVELRTWCGCWQRQVRGNCNAERFHHLLLDHFRWGFLSWFFVGEYDIFRKPAVDSNGTLTSISVIDWPDTPPVKLPATGVATLSGRSPETMLEFQAGLAGEWEVGFTPLVTSVTDPDCCDGISLILASARGPLGRVRENERLRFVADPALAYRLYLEGWGRVERSWQVSARALSASTSVPAPGTLGLIAVGLLLTFRSGVNTFRPSK
jgi:hypothetical protein